MKKSIIIAKQAFPYFDENMMPIKSAEFKYLMVSTDNKNLQMLLMIEYCPFSYHAESVKWLMEKEELEIIKINGGGIISFGVETNEIVIYEKSYAFGKVCIDEVVEFLKEKFPGFVVDSSNMFNDINIKRMHETGKIFNLEQIQRFIDRP